MWQYIVLRFFRLSFASSECKTAALAFVKPISTIKAAFPSFDVLFSLAVVVVVVLVVVAVGGSTISFFKQNLV